LDSRPRRLRSTCGAGCYEGAPKPDGGRWSPRRDARRLNVFLGGCCGPGLGTSPGEWSARREQRWMADRWGRSCPAPRVAGHLDALAPQLNLGRTCCSYSAIAHLGEMPRLGRDGLCVGWAWPAVLIRREVWAWHRRDVGVIAVPRARAVVRKSPHLAGFVSGVRRCWRVASWSSFVRSPALS